MQGKRKIIRLHRGWSLAIGIVVTLVIAGIVFLKSGLLSYQVSKYVNDHYLAATPFRFSCGRISGNMVNHISIVRPVILYQEDGVMFEVFRADRVSIRYNVIEIARLRMIVDNLEIDRPRLTVREKANGKLLIPELPSEDGSVPEGGVPAHVEIKNFTIDDADVAYERPDTTYSVRDLDLRGSFSFIDHIGDIDVDEGRARLPDPGLTIQALRARMRFSSDELNVDNLAIRLEKSLIILSGKYRDGRLYKVQGVFNPLDLSEVSELGWLSDEGQVGGNIVVDGRLDSLGVSGSLTGRGAGLVFSKLTFGGLVDSTQIHLSNIQGTVFGSRLSGDMVFQRLDGSFSFQGVCEGLDINEGFVSNDEIPVMDINGLVNLDYSAPQELYDVRLDLRRSSIREFEADEINAHLTWREATGLRVRSATFVRPGFTLTGSGSINPEGEVDFIFGVSGTDMAYLSEYLELPEIDGSLDLSGHLAGPGTRMQLNLNGTGTDVSFLFAAIDSARLSVDVRDIGGADVVATINITGKHLELQNRVFDNPHFLIEATESQVFFRDASFSRQDTFITSAFAVIPDDSASVIMLSHLQIQTPQAIWNNDGQSVVHVSEHSARVDRLVLKSGNREIGVRGGYSLERDSTQLEFWGRDIDLELIHDTFSLPYALGGVGEFDLTVYGSTSSPSVDLSVTLSEGVIDSFVFDRLAIDATFTPGERYRINRLYADEGGDSLTMSGSWGFDVSPITAIRSGFDRDRAIESPVSLRLKAYRYPLPSIFRAVHQRRFWEGAFDGDLVVENTLADPRIMLNGALVSRPRDRYQLPPIATDVKFEGGMVSIRSMKFDDGKIRGTIVGSIPFRVGLGENRAVGDTPLDFSADIQADDLSALKDYFSQVAAARGRFNGNLRITGTVDAPVFDGRMQLRECGFRLAGTEEVFRDVEADLTIRQNRIDLTRVAGAEGRKGSISGLGSAHIDGFSLKDYQVTLDMSDFSLSTIPDVELTQSGQLRISSVVGPDGRIVPSLTGAITVKQATISKSFGSQGGRPDDFTLPTESPSWLCNLEIEAPKNVWIRNPDFRMEVGGNIILMRDQQGLYFLGDLQVLRGSYSLYGNKFTITEGNFDFSTANKLRPQIHIGAYTRHQSGNTNNRIFVDLSWPADKPEPQIILSYSEPGYSEADLWRMLGGQVVGDLTTVGTAQNIASNYLERILSTQMADMTVEVESRALGSDGTTGNLERELSIAVGKYLSEDLYFKYRQGLSSSPTSAINVEYRMSRLILLRSEIIRHSRRGLQGKSRQSSDEINLDIKFRWEY
ncbi:MAG: translocation/assembly module TamB domain-containing protein [bacterium]|nr:translocation/assembly module TamB domain-containing protein [bacterium]